MGQKILTQNPHASLTNLPAKPISSKPRGFCSAESQISTDFTYFIYTKLDTLPSSIFFGFVVY